jgi:hypothetical protein
MPSPPLPKGIGAALRIRFQRDRPIYDATTLPYHFPVLSSGSDWLSALPPIDTVPAEAERRFAVW